MEHCCCNSMGNCSSALMCVPDTYRAQLTDRFGPIDPFWCSRHKAYFCTTEKTTCIRCLKVKPATSLRPANSWVDGAFRGQRICIPCTRVATEPSAGPCVMTSPEPARQNTNTPTNFSGEVIGYPLCNHSNRRNVLQPDR